MPPDAPSSPRSSSARSAPAPSSARTWSGITSSSPRPTAQIVGFLAYRTDWFQCTFVTLVVVREDYRRKGIAREFFKSVEVISPTPRLFSSTEETNGVSIRMHTALGFTPSGHVDNLPQGTRELLFYRRIPPRGA